MWVMGLRAPRGHPTKTSGPGARGRGGPPRPRTEPRKDRKPNRPTGKTTTGSPAATARRTDAHEPGEADRPPETNPTTPAPRPGGSDRGDQGGRPTGQPEPRRSPDPPAHQATEAPADTARATRAGNRPDQKPRPEAPPTANTETRAGATARATDKADASTPDAHPTANAPTRSQDRPNHRHHARGNQATRTNKANQSHERHPQATPTRNHTGGQDRQQQRKRTRAEQAPRPAKPAAASATRAFFCGSGKRRNAIATGRCLTGGRLHR